MLHQLHIFLDHIFLVCGKDIQCVGVGKRKCETQTENERRLWNERRRKKDGKFPHEFDSICYSVLKTIFNGIKCESQNKLELRLLLLKFDCLLLSFSARLTRIDHKKRKREYQLGKLTRGRFEIAVRLSCTIPFGQLCSLIRNGEIVMNPQQ